MQRFELRPPWRLGATLKLGGLWKFGIFAIFCIKWTPLKLKTKIRSNFSFSFARVSILKYPCRIKNIWFLESHKMIFVAMAP